jgi:hypothetical protein
MAGRSGETGCWAGAGAGAGVGAAAFVVVGVGSVPAAARTRANGPSVGRVAVFPRAVMAAREMGFAVGSTGMVKNAERKKNGGKR